MRSSQHPNQSFGAYGVILLVFIFCIMMIIHQTANASHMLGAELTYEHVSGQKYLVKYTLYRDCNGISAPANMNLKVSSESRSFASFHSLELDVTSGQEINNFCPSVQSTCQGGNFTGIQSWKYSCETEIPFSSGDWIFSVTDCCRNSGITTISNPSSANIYVEAFLNNTLGPNSLGEFTTNAETQLIVGQQQTFHAGVHETDGDELVYRLSTPKTSSDQLVNFVYPYHQNKPLGSEMRINSETGEISITPAHLLTGIFSVEILEYRNGIHIGTISRDMQVSVIASANEAPALTGINGTSENTITACKGSDLSFDIYSNDANSDQQLNLSWKTNIADANISIGSGLQPATHFFLGAENLKPGTYTLSIQISDNACPFIAVRDYNYTIVVSDLAFELKSTNVTCPGHNDGAIESLVSGGTQPYSFNWSDLNVNSASRRNLEAGNYSVIITDAKGCSANKAVSIETNFNAPIVALNGSLSGCIGRPLLLEAGIDAYSYFWSDNSSNNSMEVTSSGTYSVEVTNENGCSSTGTVNVIFQVCSGMDEKYISQNAVNVYPNPVKDIVNIQFDNFSDGSVTFAITDIRGQVIERYQKTEAIAAEQTINLAHLNAGVYILLIQTTTELHSVKFCKL